MTHDEAREVAVHDWRAALKAAFARPGVLDAMERGLRSGGFPMIDGEMVNWSDWLVHRIEIEARILQENRDGE